MKYATLQNLADPGSITSQMSTDSPDIGRVSFTVSGIKMGMQFHIDFDGLYALRIGPDFTGEDGTELALRLIKEGGVANPDAEDMAAGMER